MTTSLHRHLLLKLSKAQTLGEKGFTLIELLVVIIIIGILAAVALPSLLSQTERAKAAEAKTTIGAIARAEQAYYLEHNAYTDVQATLGTGADTTNFNYTLTPSGTSLQIKAEGITGNNSKIECIATLSPPNQTTGAPGELGAFSSTTAGKSCP